MTFHHFNIETIGIAGAGRDDLANTFTKLAAKGKLNEHAANFALVCTGRAQPGLSLAQPDAAEATDINASNEATQ